MATGKKFFWLKLKTDFFFDNEAIKFLLSQPNGSDYVVIYQMLLAKTINTGGILANQVNEVLILYDAKKIQQECIYFSLDTIYVALELYKKLGLICTEENGLLKMQCEDCETLEITDFALQKKKQRKKKKIEKIEQKSVDNVHSNVHQDVYNNVHQDVRGNVHENVHTELELELELESRLNSNEFNSKKREEKEKTSDEVLNSLNNEYMTLNELINTWNQLPEPIPKVDYLNKTTNMYAERLCRNKTKQVILDCMEIIKDSDFLKGKKGWRVSFGWFVRSEHFHKIMSGNYNNAPVVKQKMDMKQDYDIAAMEKLADEGNL